MTEKTRFIVFIIGAVVLSYIPILHWPFSWLETYFHEISHGIAALVSGGHINVIVLNLDGSGLCQTQGGWRPLVAFSGYLGAVIWGAVVYLGARASGKANRWLAPAIVLMIAISAVMWVRDIITMAILTIICTALYLSFRHLVGRIFPSFMQFAGVYIMVSAAHAPLNLIDGRSTGDGATLARLTFIPEIVWVALWCAIAAGTIITIWRKT